MNIRDKKKKEIRERTIRIFKKEGVGKMENWKLNNIINDERLNCEQMISAIIEQLRKEPK